jgi:hypothetical protein
MTAYMVKMSDADARETRERSLRWRSRGIFNGLRAFSRLVAFCDFVGRAVQRSQWMVSGRMVTANTRPRPDSPHWNQKICRQVP